MTLLPTPTWAAPHRSCPENGIAVDSCMADAIIEGWAKGVQTLGSCCGHGKSETSVVLSDDPKQIQLANEVFPEWELLQWQSNSDDNWRLVTVNTP